MIKGPMARYQALLDEGDIERDVAQHQVAEQLQRLSEKLASYKRSGAPSLFSLFSRNGDAAPKGLYIYGGVGRGKTMLMDLFYEDSDVEPKQRLHFHEFMMDVHDRIGEARKTVDGDPIPVVAKDIAEKALLLCFDEFHVTDIADAMILGRLFTALYEANVVVVATSNAAPDDLYRDGLNRHYFTPFIDVLKENMAVMELQSEKDYRLERLMGEELFFVPANDTSSTALTSMFQKLTGHEAGEPCELTVKGRTIPVPEAAMGVARFTFSELCENPLGAADYLKIAHTFHTVLIEGVPIMGPDKRNEARRFNTLIDALYDNSIGLIMSADAEPDDLYIEGDGSFLFERTASRLNEMRSHDYLASRDE